MKIQMKKRYVRLDAWGRGYYEFDNSIFSSAYMAKDDYGNKSVKDRINEIKKRLNKIHIKYRVVKTRISNLFSVGIDVLVPIEMKEKALGVI